MGSQLGYLQEERTPKPLSLEKDYFHLNVSVCIPLLICMDSCFHDSHATTIFNRTQIFFGCLYYIPTRPLLGRTNPVRRPALITLIPEDHSQGIYGCFIQCTCTILFTLCIYIHIYGIYTHMYIYIYIYCSRQKKPD